VQTDRVDEQHRLAVRRLHVLLHGVLRNGVPFAVAVRLIEPLVFFQREFRFDRVGVVAAEFVPIGAEALALIKILGGGYRLRVSAGQGVVPGEICITRTLA
jgi:hypothetical protein